MCPKIGRALGIRELRVNIGIIVLENKDKGKLSEKREVHL
jgi:hypothetical protein